MADLAYRTIHAMNLVKARQQLIKTYQETKSISETARRWHTSRQVVRKWLRRFEAQGLQGLQDLSRRPHSSPRQTAHEIEQVVRDARLATGYGRERLALYLQADYGELKVDAGCSTCIPANLRSVCVRTTV